MKLLRIIGKLFWNKYTKYLFIAVAAIIVLLKIWDCWDFAYSRGSADAQEMAREEKLWKLAAEIYNDNDDYYNAKVQAVKERSFKKADYLVSYDVDYFAFMPLDTVKIGKSAARCLAVYNQRKQRLWNLSDDGVFGYRDAAFTLCELSTRGLMCDLMKDEMLFNAQSHYKRQYCDKKTLTKYYELYNDKYQDEEFKYTDTISLEEQHNFLPLGVMHNYWFCAKEHGGYRLWQGCSSASVSAELDADLGACSCDINTKGPTRIRCLERRLQGGSKYAAFCLPIFRRFSLPVLLQKYSITVWNLYVVLLQMHLPADGFLDTLCLGDKYILHNFNFPQNREERWWRIINNLALNTDNYVLSVKYGVRHKPDSDKRCVHILPKYGKNSAEMKLCSDNIAADLLYCRRRLQSAEFAGVPELKKAGLEFCSASEEILRTWERYRQGKIDYKVFCRTIKKNEKVYENKRRAFLSLRWDYMYGLLDGCFVYLCLSLYCDGVPKTAVDSLKEAKMSE